MQVCTKKIQMEKIEINGKPFELYAQGEFSKDSNPILAVGNTLRIFEIVK